MSELKFCTVCASNNNRSMEGHKVLKDNGFNVSSFGTGSAMRLPGPSADKPNVYPFGTPYEDIYQELIGQDTQLYTNNGLLYMIDRNRKIKKAPERWQENFGQVFDVVFTCEERCFDAVIEDLMHRGGVFKRMVHVINLDIKDDKENASIGAQGILELAKTISSKKQKSVENEEVILEDQMMTILAEWQKKHPNLQLLYNVAYY